MSSKQRRSQPSAGGARGPAAGGQAPAKFGQAAQLFAQAVQAHQANRLAEAEALYRQVVELDPGQADAWNQLGIINGQKKENGAAATEFFARAVALRPNSADFVNNLGIAQLKQENFGAAQDSFEKAIRLNPWLAQAHYNLGLALRKQRKPLKAIACFRQAIALVPNYANAYLSLGNVLSNLGKCDDAVAEYRKLLSITPQARVVHYNIAMAYKAAFRYEEGAREAQKILDAEPDNALGHNIMSAFLWSVGRHNEAETSARRAIALDPSAADPYARLGTVLIALGRFDEAVVNLRKALELYPEHAEAHYNLVTASKAYSTPEFAARIEAIIPNDRTPQQTRILHFTLGKIYDDLGDYARAFKNYSAGNDIVGRTVSFDPKAWDAIIDHTVATFGAGFFAARRNLGSDSRRPIFIFGMPRTGTTLVEQILASHPKVAAGGELETLIGLVKVMPERLGTTTPYPECALEIDAHAARDLAGEYLAALDKLDSDAARVTDKTPFNFMNLGLIATLFPKATLIHCRRDPLDTCLSCYTQNFQRELTFTFSMENLGAYYRAYRRVMDHWRQVLPVPMLEVDYEELVENPEDVSRRIIAHCGLEWDDRCLEFHKTERAVRTASVWQVRQPIYKSAKRRWNNYEAFLGPLREALGEYADGQTERK